MLVWPGDSLCRPAPWHPRPPKLFLLFPFPRLDMSHKSVSVSCWCPSLPPGIPSPAALSLAAHEATVPSLRVMWRMPSCSDTGLVLPCRGGRRDGKGCGSESPPASIRPQQAPRRGICTRLRAGRKCCSRLSRHPPLPRKLNKEGIGRGLEFPLLGQVLALSPTPCFNSLRLLLWAAQASGCGPTAAASPREPWGWVVGALHPWGPERQPHLLQGALALWGRGRTGNGCGGTD